MFVRARSTYIHAHICAHTHTYIRLYSGQIKWQQQARTILYLCKFISVTFPPFNWKSSCDFLLCPRVYLFCCSTAPPPHSPQHGRPFRPSFYQIREKSQQAEKIFMHNNSKKKRTASQKETTNMHSFIYNIFVWVAVGGLVAKVFRLPCSLCHVNCGKSIWMLFSNCNGELLFQFRFIAQNKLGEEQKRKATQRNMRNSWATRAKSMLYINK